MDDNTQTHECQINNQINSGNNIDARKAIIYSLIVVWFKHINQNATKFCDFKLTIDADSVVLATEFCDFVDTEINKNINFKLTIDTDFATRTTGFAFKHAEDLANSVKSATDFAYYASRAALSAANASKEEYASRLTDYAKSAVYAAYAAYASSAKHAEDLANSAKRAKELGDSAESARNFAESAIYYLIAAYIYLM